MSRHAPLVNELAARLRELDIASLVYFHTDHFEPWRPVGGAPAVGSKVVDAIGDFCRVTERLDFARRLTLFYKPHLNYALRPGDDLLRADPRDLVGFLPPSEHEKGFGQEAMREVASSSAHDVQVHIHHEYYTATTAHRDAGAIAWFASPLGRALDGQRLELAIHLNREIIARETGRRSTRWFFIHGHWALNGSDDSSCTITNEIEILLRNGCRGDFTFPAGRRHVNPRIMEPYFCRPFDAPKGYDRPEAEPEVAFGNATAAVDKFFIWASSASNVQCSLDYMSPGSRRQLEDTGKAARDLIDTAYSAGRRLFIKTHAHSMHPHYFEHARVAVFPHQYPATQTLLSLIFEAADQAGLEVQFLNVPEVYDLIVSASPKPQVDLVATYLTSDYLPPAVGAQSAKPKGAAVPPARAVELVCETAAVVLRRRIDTLGIRGSGAYEHYSAMLEHGGIIPYRDLAALEIIRQHVPRLSAYHEVGSGLGALPLLLALNGFPAVGIECDRRRHETALAIARELSAHAGVGAPVCRLVLGRFPTAVAKDDVSDALAILTDFVTTQTPEQVEAILGGLRRYPYVLLDLRRFCILRDRPESRNELLDDLLSRGFVRAGDVAPGVDSAFVLLRNPTLLPRRKFDLWSFLKSPWRSREVVVGRPGVA